MIPPSTRLRRAIILNEPLLVSRLISTHPALLQNPSLHEKSNTSLHLCALHNRPQIIPILLAAGHENGEISRNTDSSTPLHLACSAGHVDCAALLVEGCPLSIGVRDKDGRDALALSALNPASTAVLPLLLNHPTHPANPHTRDNAGNTPLHHASAAGSLKALRILISAGANPLAKNDLDWTPLAYSQTVAAEVYFRNLVAEFERVRIEGVRAEGERERARGAGVRIVDDDGVEGEDERATMAVGRKGEGWGSGVMGVRIRAGSAE
nr:hypothetical protein B0A51_02149 [Rachicladosporium sp. CCFEE 5018]